MRKNGKPKPKSSTKNFSVDLKNDSLKNINQFLRETEERIQKQNIILDLEKDNNWDFLETIDKDDIFPSNSDLSSSSFTTTSPLKNSPSRKKRSNSMLKLLEKSDQIELKGETLKEQTQKLEEILRKLDSTQKELAKKNDYVRKLNEKYSNDQFEVENKMKEYERYVDRLKQDERKLRIELRKEKENFRRKTLAQEKIIKEKERKLEKEKLNYSQLEGEMVKAREKNKKMEVKFNDQEYRISSILMDVAGKLSSSGTSINEISASESKLEKIKTVLLKEFKDNKRRKKAISKLESKLVEEKKRKKEMNFPPGSISEEVEKRLKNRERKISELKRKDKNRFRQLSKFRDTVVKLNRALREKRRELKALKDEVNISQVSTLQKSTELEERDVRIVELEKENQETKDSFDLTFVEMKVFQKKGKDMKGLIKRLYREYIIKNRQIQHLTKELEKLSVKYRFTQNVLIVFILIVAFFFAIHSIEFL